MPRTRYHAAQFGGSADEVEVAFYEALQQGDLEQLMACWADEDDIVCVHPGGPRLVGAAAIRQAFELMFSQGTIRATPERLRSAQRRRHAPRLGGGHQRLPQDHPGLAPGAAPCQPGAQRSGRSLRAGATSALSPKPFVFSPVAG